jgi:fatty acid desaturase
MAGNATLGDATPDGLRDGAQAVQVGALLAAFVCSLAGQVFVFRQTPTSEYARRAAASKPAGTVYREALGEAVVSPAEAASIAAARASGASRSVTWAEVKKHNSRGDAWLVVDGKAFDVTPFVERHPGGFRPIVAMAGRDSTEVMNEFHPAGVFDKLLPQYYVGDVTDYAVPELVRDYRAIRQDLLARGLFRTDMWFYWANYAWLASILAPTLYGVLACESLAAHLLSAAGMALFWQQLAFVGHDLGHSAVSHSRGTDFFWGGLIGNFLGGIGLSWWKHSHETHHVTCNSIEMDPDIQHLPFLAITDKIFQGRFWSTYHLRWFETDALARAMVSYQHWLFYPIMSLARFNLYAQSWILLLARAGEKVPNPKTEMASLLGFWLWYGLLLAQLPSWPQRLAYLYLSHALCGVLHVQITLSHFISDTFHGKSDETWIKHQMLTTTDITCPHYMDWFHGGLQFQLEHHLFPRLPRHHLRIARERVLELSLKHGLPYREVPFLDANRKLVAILRSTAMQARKLERGDAGFYTSPIVDAVNVRG